MPVLTPETDDWKPICSIFRSALLWKLSEEITTDLDLASRLNDIATQYFPADKEINSLTETEINMASPNVKILVYSTFQEFAKYLIQTNDQFDGSIDWVDRAKNLKLEAKLLLD